MNAALLIDAIVRQTVVLIATLATGAGQRASLSHVADQVFTDLVAALKEQGLGNKLIADMFGMALRTYHSRVAQLSESRTDQGRSLWEAVYGFIEQRGPLLRSAVLARFGRDDSSVVRAVLRDLCDSGLVYRSGRGDGTSYRATEAEAGSSSRGDDGVLLSRMLLVAIHRQGPISAQALGDLLRVDDRASLDAALLQLCAERLAAERAGEGGDGPLYSCERCVIPFGDDQGWEAAVFDHYQAMVTALVTKLRRGERRAALADQVGGSTFVFDLFDGHPMQDEVLGFLSSVRAQGLSLRARIDALANQPPPGARALRVVAYVGQSVAERDQEDGDV